MVTKNPPKKAKTLNLLTAARKHHFFAYSVEGLTEVGSVHSLDMFGIDVRLGRRMIYWERERILYTSCNGSASYFLLNIVY